KNIPDWVISAKEMGGIKFLDEEITARQIRAVCTYLNRNDLVGEVVRNRVIQGCSRARLTRDIWLTPDLNKFKGLWKDNLACRTLVEAKRKGLNFARREDLWRVHGEGATFAELLNEKELKKAVRSLQEKRSRVAEWNKILQNRLIDKSDAGAILRAEYTARDPNSLSTSRQKDIISRDKRRKEWFCWNSEEEKIVGRTEVKGKKSFVMEHWYEKENFDPSLGLLTRCTGCKNSSSNIRNQSPNCLIRRKYKATGTVIPVSKVNATTWRLDVALDTCLQSKSVLDRYRDRE
ncbi:19580_t:CDS:2, partial [Gigaspora rosea]